MDNCRSNGTVAGLKPSTKLSELSLINTGLTSLRGFPELPNLTKLHLANNRLSSGLNILTKCTPSLRYLNIANNRVKPHTLEPLSDLKKLRYVDIGGNTDLEKKIRELCQHVRSVDGKDCHGNPVEYVEDTDDDASRVGDDEQPLAKMRRLEENEEESDDEENTENENSDEDSEAESGEEADSEEELHRSASANSENLVPQEYIFVNQNQGVQSSSLGLACLVGNANLPVSYCFKIL